MTVCSDTDKPLTFDVTWCCFSCHPACYTQTHHKHLILVRHTTTFSVDHKAICRYIVEDVVHVITFLYNHWNAVHFFTNECMTNKTMNHKYVGYHFVWKRNRILERQIERKKPYKESETEQETENSRHLRSKKIKINRTIQSHQGRDQEFENCLEKQQANKNEKELQKEHDNSGGSNTQSKRRISIERQSKRQL